MVQVIRRSTPVGWRQHSEFEDVANACLAEAVGRFDAGRGVPFEGFLAQVARRRVPELLRRYAAKSATASTDEEWVQAYLEQRGGQADDLAQPPNNAIVNVDSWDVVQRFARSLPPAEAEIVMLFAGGLSPAEVARRRRVGRSAVSQAISRMRPKAEVLKAA
ncbi:hypothetical protein [Krasilnikovia sp. M28-CT-15]|uniref:hypothetical protein n=1 Tax=Krasilnikovia sp. M28-CT-15 TaxID=3373540 RepID=UPI00399C9FF3